MGNVDDAALICTPKTMAYFEIERALDLDHLHVDIRRYGWTSSSMNAFEAPSNYIDLSLSPRSNAAGLMTNSDRSFEPPGEVVFFPSGTCFRTFAEPSDHRLLTVTFSDRMIEGMLDDGHEPVALRHCLDVRLPTIRQGLMRIAQEIACPGFAHASLIEALTLSMLVDISRGFGLTTDASCDGPNGKMAPWRVRRVIDYIAANLSKHILISDIADECGISAHHLMRTFKSTAGLTVSDYIAEERITRAKNALVSTSRMIKQISADCGFTNAAAFSTSFRKATGMTPREYRQQMSVKKSVRLN